MQGPERTYLAAFAFLAATFFLFLVPAQSSDREIIPVPRNVIYAGQVISAQLLGDRVVPKKYLARVSVFTNPNDIVGKVARTTLMPNRPIPTNYLMEPNVVEVNRRALMRFRSGSLRITAEVLPLNAARAGEPVRARNMQTGVIVFGIANVDGSITAGAYQ